MKQIWEKDSILQKQSVHVFDGNGRVWIERRSFRVIEPIGWYFREVRRSGEIKWRKRTRAARLFVSVGRRTSRATVLEKKKREKGERKRKGKKQERDRGIVVCVRVRAGATCFYPGASVDGKWRCLSRFRKWMATGTLPCHERHFIAPLRQRDDLFRDVRSVSFIQFRVCYLRLTFSRFSFIRSRDFFVSTRDQSTRSGSFNGGKNLLGEFWDCRKRAG